MPVEARPKSHSPREVGVDDRPRLDGPVLLGMVSLHPGGGEQVVCLLSRELVRLGVGCHVLCLEKPGDLAASLPGAGVPVHCLDSTSGYDWRAIARLRSLLGRLRPAVVHLHDRPSLLYTVAANRLRVRRVPIVYTGHGLLFGEPQRGPWRYRTTIRGVKAFTAVSAQASDRHRAFMDWSREVTLVPNGVPEAAARPGAREAIRGELGLADDAFVFLAIGNARPEKGFEDLLTAADAMRAAHRARRAVWLVAGRVDESAYCRELFALRDRLRLQEAVRFLGFRSDADDLRAAADAFVLPSRSEGLPMVVLEAMMAGVPVVATKVGGVGDALGDAGLLVEPRSPEALAEAMRSLMDSPQRAAALGTQARQRARCAFSLERMAEGYLDVYRQVARPRGGRPIGTGG